MRILHVEDNPLDADLTRRLLARQAPDIQVEPASTLAAALYCLQECDRYDLALVDLKLPDGSGLELLAQIRERQLPLAVVMLTGSGDPESAIAALQAGADDYLGKDRAADRLPAILSDALQRFRTANARRAHPLRVLYAEHNGADIDLTRRHLARHAPHIRLTVVADIAQVLERLPFAARTSDDYDAVLLDYRLPGLNALEAVKILRSERGLDIPVVLVSGQGSEELAARAIHLGVNDYISKHTGYLHKLPATLEKVVGQQTLTRERANLRETARRLELALASSPVILYTRRLDDPDAPLTWVSENIFRLLGYTAEQMLQPGWWAAHLHPDDREDALACLAALGAARPIPQDYRFLDGQGRIRWIHDELRLADRVDATVREATGAWHDVTDAKSAEQLQATRLTVLDGLVGNQPLSGILDHISNRLEAIHPHLRVAIEVWDEHPDPAARAPAAPLASPGKAPDATDRPGADWSIPLRDGAGHALGRFSVTFVEPQSLKPTESDLIDEFARIAGLAVTRVRADTRLRQAATVFESTREGVIITDLNSRILSVNRAYTDITGYSEDEVRGRKPSLMQSGRQDPSFYQTLWANIAANGHWQGEIWNRRKNGELYPQLLSISAVYDSQGQPSHYVGVMTDISQLKESEARLEHLVHYDPLTNLPNRRLVQSRLQHALEHAERYRHRIAVLFLDLDRFKNVNDSLGHPVGDELLEALTRRLSQRLREDDTLGRLGGDEFLILLENLERPEDAGGVAQTLLQLLETPFRLPSGPELYVGASIGISLYPDDGDSVTELIKHADVALYQAKEQGRNTYRFYTPKLTAAANERLALEARLHRALANDEFVLHYQPQFETDSGALIGCEALVRWHSPEEGMISPARFIPLTEETGLIVPLGEWVLRSACTQGRRWMDAGHPEVTIAVNLSGRQFQQHDLARRVAAILDETGLPADRLKLELTESMIMGHGEQVVELLHALKTLGSRLSIDDFGTGYSSLAYLKRFPIDELKIDQGFVRDIPQDENDMEIAATIIAMARNLNLKVIAEGVETRAQLDFLTRQGCHACQGYLFGRPMPADEFARTFFR
ncbi:EAL domain-containing protein [Thiocystis violascens]|uniref:cyclic-guanylate-specific phosphodiesterase n=1 Tax=Thiocystis violascens (strain ATCC 17096 / DSM 198 / 6111) TaxID=765911 RepID=I3YBB6_THIV6|nr:EAL domain-containing protein [Thiocystis violascens]AFL74284.1 PAS domain S-box/diguanylate cyclase (GGDEF) domain-containing protein [Thiocystis violascens DSM 198]